MGNWSWFRGCGSEGEACVIASRGDAADDGGAFGPTLGAKYRVPLFWLAGFTSKDLRTVRSPFSSEEEGEEPYIEDMAILCARGADIAPRLRQRREIVLSAVHPDFAATYDAWIAYVAASYPAWVLVECSDVFSMGGVEEGSELLVAGMAQLDQALPGSRFEIPEPLQMLSATDPTGEPIYRAQPPLQQAQDWMVGLVGGSDDLGWIPEPTPALLALAEATPVTSIGLQPAGRKPWWKFW